MNSKSLDVALKIPPLYKEKEQYLRTQIAQALERGKIELSISIDNSSAQQGNTLNKPLIIKYFKELQEISYDLAITVSDQLLAAVLRMPEVIKQEVRELQPQEWDAVSAAVQQALEQNIEFRDSEGQHMEKDLNYHYQQIGSLLEQIPPLEQTRMDNLKNRMIRSLEELKDSVKADPNRFEQELIYYLEKLDISEEKVRLAKHLEYFKETMNEPSSNGKKLAFISQEMGREINTIGSKANDADIQKLVVQMKDELEKIKEQMLNIL